VSRKATGTVELYLGSTGKRWRQSLIGSTVVDDYSSTIHGRVIILKLAPKPAEPKKPRKAKAEAENFDPLVTEYPAVKAGE